MCGIIGFSWEDKTLLKEACDSLEHRGPDSKGYYSDKDISLGHRRLSIIDLSERANQPMSNEDGSIWTIYNGEIYNFQELRTELEKKGHKFKSSSDTEVIIHGYEEWGLDCVKKFNGMFAFGLWDSNKKSLFLARDRLGQKPLFYAKIENKIIFASEIKALLKCSYLKREINLNAVNYFLTFSYIPSQETIYREIYQLLPGHILTYKNNKTDITKYWDLEFEENNKNKRYYLGQIESLLNDSIEKIAISDVPLGVFLSGGLDSSLITALITQNVKKVKTFSIGFGEREFNETCYAREIADYLGTDHKEFIVESSSIKILPKMIYHFDQPFADPSALPFYYLSKLTRKHVKVALSGDGADELFAGYRRYLGSYMENKVKFIPPPVRKLLININSKIPISRKKYDLSKYISKTLKGANLKSDEKHLYYMSHFDDKLKGELYKKKLKETKSCKLIFNSYLKNLKSNNSLDKAQYLDIKTYLPDDILVKTDRMSMAHSLEVRCPFLDHRLFELISKTPTNLRLNGIKTKFILKKFAESYIPKKIIYRKKGGFSVPLNMWFDNELKDITSNLLTSKDIENREYFNIPEIRKIINNHLNRKNEYSIQLWTLLNLELWHKIYIDNEGNTIDLNKLIR